MSLLVPAPSGDETTLRDFTGKLVGADNMG